MVYETTKGERPFLGSSEQEQPIPEKKDDKLQKAEKTSDPFWFKNYEILFRYDRLTEFVPIDDFSYVEKLNSILRFAIYTAIALIIYRQQLLALLFPIAVAAITIYLYQDNPRQYIGHGVDDKKCTPSTIANPFMNVLMSDYTDNPDRPPACDESEEKIDYNFRRNLYRNSFDDIYGKGQSRRQFYTMPVTDIEQSGYENYINWLYNTGPTCKTDNSKCDVYTDVRYKRRPVQYTLE